MYRRVYALQIVHTLYVGKSWHKGSSTYSPKESGGSVLIEFDKERFLCQLGRESLEHVCVLGFYIIQNNFSVIQ